MILTFLKRYLKDILITAILLAAIALQVSYYLQSALKDLPTLCGQIILLILGFVGIIDISLHCDLTIFVPNFLMERRRQKEKELASQYMSAAYSEDIKFVRAYDEARMDYFMSQLGISKSHMDDLRLDLVKLRVMPIKTIEDAREKVKYLIGCDSCTVRQRERPDSEITYKKVDYFINFVDLMYISEYAREISAALGLLIQENIELQKIDKIVVPYDSNFLLAFELGKLLGKPIVNIRRTQGKIIREQHWDGILSPTDRVIVIHDVLVTGQQVVESMRKLPESCEQLAFFCLVSRKEWPGKKAVEDRGIPFFSLLELDDSGIARLLETH